MHTPIFKGAAVALVTPMNQDGTVNYDKLTELIEFQIKGGTDAIVACGTTGGFHPYPRGAHQCYPPYRREG